MLDLRRVRQDPEGIRRALATKREPGALEALDELLAADRAWRALLGEAEALRARRNALAAEVGRRRREGGSDDEALLAEARAVADRLRGLEERLGQAEARVRELLLAIPNVPDAEVPIGEDESGNREVRRWGEPRPLSRVRAHWELGPALGVLDFERAGKVAGSRFAVYRDRGARLVRALIAFMLDMHVARHGCTEVWPPFLVNSASMLGTGNLPKFGDDAFRVAGVDLWLVPTAEVPVTNLYRDEILPPGTLPLRHVAYTPCWRSEAGAAGRDTRGLIRQHQFDKVEIVHFVAPEDSPKHLEEIVRSAEDVLEALELPYRVVEMCTADLGFSQARKFDLEVWMPSYGRYVEISSCSNFRDFQARRANIRFRRAPGAHAERLRPGGGAYGGRAPRERADGGRRGEPPGGPRPVPRWRAPVGSRGLTRDGGQPRGAPSSSRGAGAVRWVGAVVGVLVLVGAAVARAAEAEHAARPVYYVGTREKVMALTFDVSWGDRMLPQVLDVLRREHQVATFFVSGPWAATHPALVEAILQGGNELASHGQAHVNLSGRSAGAIADNVGAADAILRRYTGGRPLRFFRPPNGDWDPRVVEVARGLGYETVIWSVDSRDWMNPGVGVIVRRVVDGAFPGAIVLLHASDTCRQTDLALPTIIERLRAQGWRLVTLGTLWDLGPAQRDDPRGRPRKPNAPPVSGEAPAAA
jgi:seryl-tRNA synthetase